MPDAAEPISKERLRLWLRVLKTSRMIESRLRDNLRSEFGTTLPRFDVMAALSRFPYGLKMSQLSGVLRVSNGNVTGVVDRLADDGFVVRVAVAGDRRASLVQLTPKGHQEFAAQAGAHETWIDDMLTEFDLDDLGAIGARFEALMTSLEGKD
jgi:DNA-binding MarR family transcriptional regulator